MVRKDGDLVSECTPFLTMEHFPMLTEQVQDRTDALRFACYDIPAAPQPRLLHHKENWEELRIDVRSE